MVSYYALLTTTFRYLIKNKFDSMSNFCFDATNGYTQINGHKTINIQQYIINIMDVQSNCLWNSKLKPHNFHQNHLFWNQGSNSHICSTILQYLYMWSYLTECCIIGMAMSWNCDIQESLQVCFDRIGLHNHNNCRCYINVVTNKQWTIYWNCHCRYLR